MKDIKNIAIYGSCVSKDPFTTRFNKDYKKKYNCVVSDQRHSFISTMQERRPQITKKVKLFAKRTG